MASRYIGAAVGCALLGMQLGCSYIFLTPPTKPEQEWVERRHDEEPPPEPAGKTCTSGYAAPIMDTIFAGFEAFRTGYALQASSSAYSDQPISREVDIAFGVGFTALFVASAIYGYGHASECTTIKEAAIAAPTQAREPRSDAQKELQQLRERVQKLEAAQHSPAPQPQAPAPAPAVKAEEVFPESAPEPVPIPQQREDAGPTDIRSRIERAKQRQRDIAREPDRKDTPPEGDEPEPVP